MPGERGDMKYRYTGKREDGEHLSGVPATNLYEDDLAALSPELRKQVEKSAIYKKAEDEPAPAARSASQPKTSTSTAAPEKSAGGEKK